MTAPPARSAEGRRGDVGVSTAPEAHRPLLAAARAGYLGELDERWDDVAAARAVANELRVLTEATASPLPPADASV